MTEKSDNRVGHLNTILARGGGKVERCNLQKFKCPGFSQREGGGGEGGKMLKFRVDRRIISGS